MNYDYHNFLQMGGMNIKLPALLVAAMLTLSGCGSRGRLLSPATVAQVGESVLSEDEVAAAIPKGLTPEDSLQMVDAYVNSWVRRQVKLREAEKVLQSRGVNVEAMVQDYRNSLLANRLDRYYIEQRVDSVVSDSLVAEYYEAHRPEFKLDRTIVKGRIVKLPVSFRQQAKLKELMSSSKPERQQDFLDLVVKNNLVLLPFDKWTGFDEFLTSLPTVRGKSYDELLTSKKINELSDGEYKYYIQVTDYMGKGAEAPVDWVDNVIRNIIYNKRSSDMLKSVEDSLYNAAKQNSTLKIYLQTNND